MNELFIKYQLYLKLSKIHVFDQQKSYTFVTALFISIMMQVLVISFCKTSNIKMMSILVQKQIFFKDYVYFSSKTKNLFQFSQNNRISGLNLNSLDRNWLNQAGFVSEKLVHKLTFVQKHLKDCFAHKNYAVSLCWLKFFSRQELYRPAWLLMKSQAKSCRKTINYFLRSPLWSTKGV